MELLTSLLVLLVVLVVVFVLLTSRKPPPLPPVKYHVGDVTLEALRFYSGYDWSKPPLVSIKGKIYDVSNKYELYGPGKAASAVRPVLAGSTMCGITLGWSSASPFVKYNGLDFG